MVSLQSLHPGGLETTHELAVACAIKRGDLVLDVACGTGESACYLAEQFGARVYGIDYTEELVRQARAKAEDRGLDAVFEQADAGALPFDGGRFDAVVSEATLCFLDKPRVLGEMFRVVRPGGRVGMHDLCWKEGAPEKLKDALAEIEGERPETVQEWRELFEVAGLVEVNAVDKSDAMSRWMRESREEMGWTGQLSLLAKILRRWGPAGLWRILRSERVFSSDQLGYVLMTGSRP